MKMWMKVSGIFLSAALLFALVSCASQRTGGQESSTGGNAVPEVQNEKKLQDHAALPDESVEPDPLQSIPPNSELAAVPPDNIPKDSTLENEPVSLFSYEDLKEESGSECWSWLWSTTGTDGDGLPFRIFIPALLLNSADAEAINREICERFATDIPEYLENGAGYLNVTSQVSEGDGILSLMLLREEYPIYGTDPIRWAVTVDLEKERPLSLEEMLERAGKDSAAVIEKAKAAAEGEHLNLVSMEQFFCAEDGSVQIILQVEEHPPGADPWMHYWLYDVEEDALLK